MVAIVAKRGSAAIYGTVIIRGVQVDVEVIAAQHRDREIETDAFWRWLQNADSRVLCRPMLCQTPPKAAH